MPDYDQLEKVGHSLLQHGKANDRVYLMKAKAPDVPRLLERIDALVASEDYTKVFAKLPLPLAEPFLARGYEVEALAPGFYKGSETALFLGRYPEPGERRRIDRTAVDEVVQGALAKREDAQEKPFPETCAIRLLTPQDAEKAAALYREVFASYPFPIHEPAYLVETMEDNIDYFGIWEEGELIALASAERDDAGQNAEMTDFATLPVCRGRGLATHLLRSMETAMVKKNIRCLYTIARALSHGMNGAFGRMGYHYGGTLRNNTQISGGLESMSVWYKPLP